MAASSFVAFHIAGAAPREAVERIDNSRDSEVDRPQFRARDVLVFVVCRRRRARG
jgi:hypothetical protein